MAQKARLGCGTPRARRDFVEYLYQCAGLRDPIGAHQVEWAQSLQRVAQGDLNRLAILAPRGHGKTTILAEHYVAWTIGRNPDVRVLLVSGAPDRAVRAARHVRTIIQTNPTYREVFGALSPFKDRVAGPGTAPKWAEDEFTVRRSADLAEPTVAALGAGAVIPSHRVSVKWVWDTTWAAQARSGPYWRQRGGWCERDSGTWTARRSVRWEEKRHHRHGGARRATR
ncbi:MAG: hypothetical protein MUQ26_01070 [Armatimonadetes bacterium]|nr:hypothetical protein [Armatimonadota bacterium]